MTSIKNLAFWVFVALALVVAFTIWPDLAQWRWMKPLAVVFGIAVGAVLLWLNRRRKLS